MLSLSGQSPFRPAYPVSCQPGSPGSLRRDIRRDRRCDTAMLRLSLSVGDRGQSIDRSDRAACSATLDRHVAVPRQGWATPRQITPPLRGTSAGLLAGRQHVGRSTVGHAGRRQFGLRGHRCGKHRCRKEGTRHDRRNENREGLHYDFSDNYQHKDWVAGLFVGFLYLNGKDSAQNQAFPSRLLHCCLQCRPNARIGAQPVAKGDC